MACPKKFLKSFQKAHHAFNKSYLKTKEHFFTIIIARFEKKHYFCRWKGSLYAISKGNGVRIPDCLAAVSSFNASSKEPLPMGGKALDRGMKSEDLPFEHDQACRHLSMQGARRNVLLLIHWILNGIKCCRVLVVSCTYIMAMVLPVWHTSTPLCQERRSESEKSVFSHQPKCII